MKVGQVMHPWIIMDVSGHLVKLVQTMTMMIVMIVVKGGISPQVDIISNRLYHLSLYHIHHHHHHRTAILVGIIVQVVMVVGVPRTRQHQ